MPRRKAVANGEGLTLEPQTITDLERVMLDYAHRQPTLEPVMLRIARVIPLDAVEREILKKRDYLKRRR